MKKQSTKKQSKKKNKKTVHPPFTYSGNDGHLYQWSDIRNKMERID